MEPRSTQNLFGLVTNVSSIFMLLILLYLTVKHITSLAITTDLDNNICFYFN